MIGSAIELASFADPVVTRSPSNQNASPAWNFLDRSHLYVFLLVAFSLPVELLVPAAPASDMTGRHLTMGHVPAVAL